MHIIFDVEGGLAILVDAARILVRVASPVKGGSPGYGVHHVIKALEILSQGPVGRVHLASRLGVGEASSRTLLERLEGEGLIRKGRWGAIVTERGLQVLRAVKDSVRVYRVNLEHIGWGEALLITIKGLKPPRDVVEVYSIRDYIVAEGCRETVIGGVEGGSTTYPGMPPELKEPLDRSIPREALEEGVLHLIVKPGNEDKAVNALIKLLAKPSIGKPEAW
ncbi:MAG: hypothetical protein P3X22_007715 [Thermoprotei archaeon]|nr:hypothetical protein [Thermoprotei archaeon]